ncbi:damage-inducible protein CinA [Limnohabitans sp. 2KL-1]|uniref:CinA family protein n=1 Tax=Limnohabitans sp. 2KL-1 TaxID=1100699 RepID=UPI000D399801|nr:CinA family protein [Limnohabitans sp. 2KL-1]PUE44539.1 damage-inducible protein CinA [Limnohabitans sp. 2KL-1]
MSDWPAKLAERFSTLKWQMATAESCTGGLISACCTDLAGSSAWFDRGFVTYSNDAKTQMLGVPAELIATQGAVSEAVAQAMAIGAVYRSKAQVSVAVTGVAGPSGGSPEKPVGTVWLGWYINGAITTELKHFEGNRKQVRQATVAHALEGLLIRLPLVS